MRDDGGFCAIQCKFYREGHRIQKSDIDSFFTASGKKPFTERLIIDTTNVDWSEHAEGALRDQSIDTQRISLSDIDQAPSTGAAISVMKKSSLRKRRPSGPISKKH